MRRFRNIVMATDFSRASRPALRRAVDLAVASGARLWIVHVIPSMPIASAPRMYEEMEAFVRSDSEKRLRVLIGAATAAGARARALLLHGVPHEAVRRAARAHHADLIVLGTHGRTGLARAFIGSVATRILATAPCPVLSVKQRRGSATARNLLFATDLSPASKPAWERALGLARANRAPLQIVHVLTPLAQGQIARWAYAEAEAEIRAEAWKELQTLLRRARRAGVRAKVLLVRGVAHEAVDRAARAMKDGWIVVGTHGRTGVSGAFLGSVAGRVVATAPCPVLTVRGGNRS